MDRSLFEDIPTHRIKPVDGMSVTAEVWEMAHVYHRQQLRIHERLRHGAGIVTGLEVIASDPPDSSVYVRPGVAVDGCGDVIVLTEPVAYDVGTAHGLLYLVLSYEESRPRAGRDEDAPQIIHSQFGLEARTAAPAHPALEVARFWRQERTSALLNARDAVHPGPNEIDLRFRPEIVLRSSPTASLAVCYVGGQDVRRHGRGVGLLAKTIRQSGTVRAWVDDEVALGSGLEAYSLLFLVGHGAFQLSREQMNALYGYLKAGGLVFIESCRRGTTGEPPADSCFVDLLSSLGIQLQEVPSGHLLLSEPYLFAVAPQGSADGSGRLMIGEGVILSTWDYGCLWQGEQRGRPASRESIRSAMEWGANLVTYAIERQVKRKGQ